MAKCLTKGQSRGVPGGPGPRSDISVFPLVHPAQAASPHGSTRAPSPGLGPRSVSRGPSPPPTAASVSVGSARWEVFVSLGPHDALAFHGRLGGRCPVNNLPGWPARPSAQTSGASVARYPVSPECAPGRSRELRWTGV